MEFLLGCNYWASNAGANMWREYSSDVVENDIKVLSEYGVKYFRVFPNWRDFQPVVPQLGIYGNMTGYCFDGNSNLLDKYYLDSVMLDRFKDFLSICKKYDIKVIVGLITGWMSGGLFVPPVLYGKNVVLDSFAKYLEVLFIKGFIEYFKEDSTIIAWDLGNECNCMAEVNSRWDAAEWTAMISNTIRAADSSRPVVSGMHSLEIEGVWTIKDQAMFNDILTTHPYPYWCEHSRIDENISIRTTMLPTAQNKFYSDIGKKPCLAEEIGTMGPMLCSDENSADFLRINMFSLWASGAVGIMWWCACEQSQLTEFPYSIQMVERELGMMNAEGKPKPVLKEMKKFSELLKRLDFELPKVEVDATCILTQDQNNWGIAYMTYILSRRAGLNISFAYGDDELPDSGLYMMPSVNGFRIMPKERYEALKKKVFEGADIYISVDNAVFSDFESFVGLKVIDSYEYSDKITATIDGEKFEFLRLRHIKVEPKGAEVLLYDDNKNPLVTMNHYGKGKVYYVNAPIEKELIDKHNAFSENTDLIYSMIVGENIKNKPLNIFNKDIMVTYHHNSDYVYAVILNHSAEEKTDFAKVNDDYIIEKIYYGDLEKLAAFDGCILKMKKR